MRNYKYIFVLCLLSFSATVICPLHAQLLWEISGNGAKKKSFVLATNRFVEMQFLDTIPNVFKCFSSCNKVVTEFAMQDYEALAALRQAAVLPDSVILTNFYSESEYRYIDNALRISLGMGLDQLCRMKPSYLTEMFRTELMKQWLERDIPVIGLDDIGETMYMLFDREPFHWQCKELLKVIEYPENEVRQERTLKAMYLNGRLSDMAYQVEAPSATNSGRNGSNPTSPKAVRSLRSMPSTWAERKDCLSSSVLPVTVFGLITDDLRNEK